MAAPVGRAAGSETSAIPRPSTRVPVSPRATPEPVAVPVPDRDARTIVDDQELAKDPEKGLSGVRRRMGRRLGSKQLPPEQLTKNLKKPLPRPVVVAFVQHTGGDGKSTLSAAVGQQIATHRRDRVIAIDAAVAAGGLSQRLPVQNESTIQTLLSNLASIHRWSDAREHTSQGRTGLELLTSGDSIADDAVLTAAGYERVIEVLTANDTYNLLLVDCDAGVTGELKDAILDSADVIVVPAAGRDGVSGAVVTMNRLMYLADKYPHRASHYRGLISTAVVALNHIAPKSILRDEEVATMFRERVGVREVVSVPFDPTLKDGSEVDIMLTGKATSNALLQLAAEVVTSLRRSV
ncbi:MinD/ParA family protein [Gordonia sihwensis]|uniref:MinD/ParA family ATP-binding protein n=1 Tax=Gordonia sihwensis TaxID=173559 RepID=UPI0012E04047|nr:AAA family ATPase [Gordonia sihwensis]